MERVLQVKQEAQGKKARVAVVHAKLHLAAKPLHADAEGWLCGQALSSGKTDVKLNPVHQRTRYDGLSY